jgi:hypothetical protein
MVMKYYEKIVRLSDGSEEIEFDLDDWLMRPLKPGVMYHLASGSQYLVHLPDRQGPGEIVRPKDFGAILINKGKRLPKPDELEKRGCEAIVVFLTAEGYWQPPVLPGRPKPCRSSSGEKHAR